MKEFLLRVLKFLWCKDIAVMSYGLKHFNLNLFFDWIFCGKYQYQYIRETTWEHIKTFSKYFSDKKYKKKLVKWLDEKSVEEVNQIEKNIKFVLKSTDSHLVICRKKFWIKQNKYEVEKYIKEYSKNIYFPLKLKEETVFYFKHWINEIKNLKQRMIWKDIIDCWAFVWDSALMFSKELWFYETWWINHIFCIEPNPETRKILNLTINKNDLNQNVTIIPKWLWKEKKDLHMNMYAGASFVGDASFIKNQNVKSCIINVDTIDNIVENYWIIPWLIKWDIEWLEYDSILGSKKTIKEYKPILLISIYHTWKDFYEIKPLIESWNIWYKYMIRHLSTNISEEIELICY